MERVEPTEAHQRALIDLIRVTEDRSGAFFRDDDYLLTVWNAFFAAGAGRLYFASYEGQRIAGAFVEHLRRDRRTTRTAARCETAA